jgi:hypothetical protein
MVDMPNTEVREAMLKHLLAAYSTYPVDEMDALRGQIKQQVAEGDADGLARSLTALFAVPYQIKSGKEAAYHALFQVGMRALGFNIRSEVAVENGRVDAVWEQPELTVVAELKYHATKTPATLLREALKQIRDKRYYEPFTGRVVLLGVAFTGKEVKCKVEEL